MIIWLASFPRSGNSLLRQILFYTMNHVSYHEGPEATEIWAKYAKRVGPSRESFLQKAAKSRKPFFVKTHLPPADEHRAIYVVRDGRAATASFLKYEEHFSPGSASNSLLSLILGDHYFGGWSDHYHAWHERKQAPLLTLKYDQLFAADEDVLQEIASFVGYDGAINAWDNPIEEWRERNPTLVGEGKTRWDPPDEWDFVCDTAFWELHGELMQKLGLDDGQRVPAPSQAAADMLVALIPQMRSWVERRRAMQRASDEKEDVIQTLSAAIANLTSADADHLQAAAQLRTELSRLEQERDLQTRSAAERLATIEVLERDRDLHRNAAEERLSELDAASTGLQQQIEARDLQARAAAERLATIESLERDRDVHRQAAEERLAQVDAVRAELENQSAAAREEIGQLEQERDLQTQAAAERLETIEALGRDRDLQRQAVEQTAANLSDEISRLEQERDLQAQAAAERLETIEALERDRDLQRQAAEERLKELEAVSVTFESQLRDVRAEITRLEEERDLQARAAAERLETIQALEHDRDVHREAAEERLAALDELARERDQLAVAAEQRLAAIEGLDRDRNAHPERGQDGWR